MNAPNTHSATNGQNAAPVGDLGDIVILCADEEIRDVLAYWLTGTGARVTVALDGYQATQCLQSGCNWLITDRALPPWPGLDSVISLRSRYPDMGIAFVESSNIHDGILARLSGADVLLPRPLTRQGVKEALARAGS